MGASPKYPRAEDDDGTILRFVETDGKSGTVSIKVPILDLQAAWRCTAMEKNQEPLSVSGHSLEFAIKPFEIATIRIQGKSALRLPE